MYRLGLSAKLLHTLQRAGIETLEDLRGRSPGQLALIQGIGSASLAELLGALSPPDAEGRLEGAARIAQIDRKIAQHRHAIERLERERGSLSPTETPPRTAAPSPGAAEPLRA